MSDGNKFFEIVLRHAFSERFVSSFVRRPGHSGGVAHEPQLRWALDHATSGRHRCAAHQPDCSSSQCERIAEDKMRLFLDANAPARNAALLQPCCNALV